MTFSVSRIYPAADDTWSVEFSDGVTLCCSKKGFRDESRIDALIDDHGERDGNEESVARMREMVRAVREHESGAPVAP